MAGGIAIDQGAEADLVGDAGSGEAFGDDADDDAQHGGAAIEKLSPFQLLHMNLGFCAAEIFAVSGSVCHGVKSGEKQESVELAAKLAQRSADLRGQVAGAGKHKGDHSGQHQNEGDDAGDGCGVVSIHGSKPAKVLR